MKYFFFDIDGTLHSHTSGILQSTKDTIKELMKQGHFVCVATGRSYLGCTEILLETGIEYAIVDGGHRGYKKNTVLFNEPIDRNICKEIVKEAKQLEIAVGISDDTTCYLLDNRLVEKMSREHEWMKIKIVDALPIDTLFIKKVFVDCKDKEVSKFASFKKINHLYLPKSDLVVTDQDHKLEGIHKILKEVGYTQGDIIVFGDSRNDIAMFKGATISICMENGVDEAKQRATYVTKSIEEDGIMHACRHYGWIK